MRSSGSWPSVWAKVVGSRWTAGMWAGWAGGDFEVEAAEVEVADVGDEGFGSVRGGLGGERAGDDDGFVAAGELGEGLGGVGDVDGVAGAVGALDGELCAREAGDGFG